VNGVKRLEDEQGFDDGTWILEFIQRVLRRFSRYEHEPGVVEYICNPSDL
jgi:hypothetical protein